MQNNLVNLFNSQEILNQIPGMLYWTDLDTKFVQANSFTSSVIGYDNPSQLAGLTYQDMRCEAVAMADCFMSQDVQVIRSGKSMKIVGYYCYADDDWKVLLGEKRPMYGEGGNLIGTLGHFYDVSDWRIINLSMLIHNGDSIYRSTLDRKQVNYEIKANYDKAKFSRRESETLFYLLRGKTAKGIGKSLGISNRTVECYISQLKEKFDCYTRSQLIEKCIATGLINIIPESIWSKSDLDED